MTELPNNKQGGITHMNFSIYTTSGEWLYGYVEAEDHADAVLAAYEDHKESEPYTSAKLLAQAQSAGVIASRNATDGHGRAKLVKLEKVERPEYVAKVVGA